MEAEARDAVLAEVGKHYLKGADGWTTVLVDDTGYGPEPFLRQFREITVTSVDSYGVSEADRLNGFEWVGSVEFKHAPSREVGRPDRSPVMGAVERPHGQWSQWSENALGIMSVHVQKLNGKWQVPPDRSSMLLNGEVPTAADFARAGAKFDGVTTASKPHPAGSGGPQLSGTYVGENFEELTFKPDGDVKIASASNIREGTHVDGSYAVDGKKVTITAMEQTGIFDIDDTGGLETTINGRVVKYRKK